MRSDSRDCPLEGHESADTPSTHPIGRLFSQDELAGLLEDGRVRAWVYVNGPTKRRLLG